MPCSAQGPPVSAAEKEAGNSHLSCRDSERFLEEALAITGQAKDASRDIGSLAKETRGLVHYARARGVRQILYSFDEAAGLCKKERGRTSRFHHILKALSHFNHGVLGVFLDTTSRAYGFRPSGAAGIVVGRKGDEGYWLPLYPFIFLANSRIFAIAKEFKHLPKRCAPLNGSLAIGGLLSNSFEIVFSSRPLLAALVKGAIDGAEEVDAMFIWDWILKLARAKLSLSKGSRSRDDVDEAPHTIGERE